MNKVKLFFCEYCSWKKFSNSQEDEKESIKCLSCGRLLRIRQALDPQKNIDETKKLNKIKEEQESWNTQKKAASAKKE